MRVPLLPVLIVLIIGLLIDFYIYRRLRHARTPRGWCWVYVIVSVVLTGGLLAVTVLPKKSADDSGLAFLMWTLFTYLSVYIPKCVFAVFALVQQALGWLCRRRLRGIGWTGATVAVILFGMMWWGALFNRYNIDVREVNVPIKDLPASYDGYRIVQISDMHTGSYGHDTRFLEKVVEKVNALQPDIILFTGDIVNRHSTELQPFTGVLAQLHAPDGVWSIMGNHDYGDYYSWESPLAKQADIAHLQDLQYAMGWRMLNNDHTILSRDSDSIVLIGVENIGDPPFTVYGDLSRAYPDLSDDAVKILMTHNPAHWTDSIAGRPETNVALTLSGHTHAMQIELFGLSPASFRYSTWGGIYPDSLGRHLYVNIGLGEVGMPARIGATPEITLITLENGN